MFKASRDLNKLQPEMKRRVDMWILKCRVNGLKILITEGWRSKARQLYLYAKGRYMSPKFERDYLGYDDPRISSKPGEKKVTWTLKSKHLEGKAIDFGFMAGKHFTYNGDWDKAYDLAESCGLQSLYRKYKIDRPHLEFNVNWTPVDDKELRKRAILERKFQKASEKAQDALVELNKARAKLAAHKAVPFVPYQII